MLQSGHAKESYLLIVLSVSTVLGMGVALAVYFGWISGAIPPGLNHVLTAAALVLCPPFILLLAIPPMPGSDLSVVLVVGTLVFANAFLYAGVAAGGYFLATLMMKRRTEIGG
jgi:hypothetical protein